MRRLLALALACCSCALGAAACGTTTSTAGFKGAEHEVAQTIADLQSDVTARRTEEDLRTATSPRPS